jgi:hypothetical protein
VGFFPYAKGAEMAGGYSIDPLQANNLFPRLDFILMEEIT